MGKRVFWIVLDSAGIGGAPDAADFGDKGADTFGSCYKSGEMNVPEDHAGFELEFCALLCDRAAEALEKGDAEALRAVLAEQTSFIELHLLSWLPMLQARVDEWAELRFYPAFVRIVIGMLRENLAANAELAA